MKSSRNGVVVGSSNDDPETERIIRELHYKLHSKYKSLQNENLAIDFYSLFDLKNQDDEISVEDFKNALYNNFDYSVFEDESKINSIITKYKKRYEQIILLNELKNDFDKYIAINDPKIPVVDNIDDKIVPKELNELKLNKIYFKIKKKISPDSLYNKFAEKDTEGWNNLNESIFDSVLNSVIVLTTDEKELLHDEFKDNIDSKIQYKKFTDKIQNINEENLQLSLRRSNIRNQSLIIQMRQKATSAKLNMDNIWAKECQGETSVGVNEFKTMIMKYNSVFKFSETEIQEVFQIISNDGQSIDFDDYSNSMKNEDSMSHSKSINKTQQLGQSMQIQNDWPQNIGEVRDIPDPSKNNVEILLDSQYNQANIGNSQITDNSFPQNRSNDPYNSNINNDTSNNQDRFSSRNNNFNSQISQSVINNNNQSTNRIIQNSVHPNNMTNQSIFSSNQNDILHPFIKVRSRDKFEEINRTIDENIRKQIIDERKKQTDDKINDIKNLHKRYVILNNYQKFYDTYQKKDSKKFQKRFADNSQNSDEIPLETFSLVLKDLEINIDSQTLKFILNSLKNKTSNLYSYNEFLSTIENFPKSNEYFDYLSITRTCNLQFDDYIYDFKDYIIKSKINVQSCFDSIVPNSFLMNSNEFKQFCNKIGYELSHENEYKLLFENLKGNDQFLHKDELCSLIESKLINEKEFIENGKIINKQNIYRWKTKIEPINDIEAIFKIAKQYENFKNTFESIIYQHEHVYSINDITYIFDGVNQDINQDTAEIPENVFDKQIHVKNLGKYQALKNQFKSQSTKILLAKFVQVYLCFKKVINSLKKFSEEFNSLFTDNQQKPLEESIRALDTDKDGYITLDSFDSYWTKKTNYDDKSSKIFKQVYQLIIEKEKKDGMDVIKCDNLSDLIKFYLGYKENKLIFDYSFFLYDNCLQFNKIYPSAENKNTLDKKEFINGFKLANFYVTKNEVDCLFTYFDETNKQNIDVNQLKKEILKYIPTVKVSLPNFKHSFIRELQKNLKILPCKTIFPRKTLDKKEFIDIKPQTSSISDNSNNNIQMKPIPTDVNALIVFKSAISIPSPDDSLLNQNNNPIVIVAKQLKIALLDTNKKEFISNAFSIQVKTDSGQDQWNFESEKTNFNNNILVRHQTDKFYPNSDTEIEIVFEFVLAIKQKQQITETSWGWCSCPIKELYLSNEKKLEIKGGTPLHPETLNQTFNKVNSRGAAKLLFGNAGAVLSIDIIHFNNLNSDDNKLINYLPASCIIPKASLHVVYIFRKIISDCILNTKTYKKSVIRHINFLIRSFSKIVDSPDTFRNMIELWDEVVVKGANISDYENEDYFKLNFAEFVNKIQALLNNEEYQYNIYDPSFEPIGNIRLLETRKKLMNDINKTNNVSKYKNKNFKAEMEKFKELTKN